MKNSNLRKAGIMIPLFVFFLFIGNNLSAQSALGQLQETANQYDRFDTPATNGKADLPDVQEPEGKAVDDDSNSSASDDSSSGDDDSSSSDDSSSDDPKLKN